MTALAWQAAEAFNAALHPRGPDGRFTKSFARPATPAQKKKIDYVRRGPKARRMTSPAEASQWLSGMAPPTERRGPLDAALAQLRANNQSLRAGHPAPDNAIAAAMQPTPEAVQVFRSMPADRLGNAAPGDLNGYVVSDAGYFPTSLAPTVPQPGEVRMTVDVPAGTQAAASPDTSELVLDAGLEMSVDEITANPDGSTSMHLTVLGGADGDSSDSGDGGRSGSEPANGETPAGSDAPAGAASGSAPAGGQNFDSRASAAASGPAGRAAAPAALNRDSDPPLTDDQLDALDEYQADNFDPINRLLRGGDPSEPGSGGFSASREAAQGWIDHMDSVMDQSGLTTDVQAWRGLDGTRLFGNRLSGDLTGMEFREDAYLSLSTDRDVSHGFAVGEAEGQLESHPNPVLMRVLVPAGVGAVEMSSHQGRLPESELLAQRGLTMRIVADNGVDENGVRQVDVEVVPVDQAAAEAAHNGACAGAHGGVCVCGQCGGALHGVQSSRGAPLGGGQGGGPSPPGAGALPKRGAPPPVPAGGRLTDLLDVAENSRNVSGNQALMNAFGDVFNGEYAGLRVQVNDIDRYVGGANGERRGVTALIHISDAAGNFVGEAERSLIRDGNGDLEARHDFLRLGRAQRGNGFATEFNARMTDWYRRQGVSRITLHANIDVGGYAWASHGYDFASEDDANNVLDRVIVAVDEARELVVRLRAVGDTARADALEVEVAAVDKVLARARNATFGSADYPTPYEISQAGRSDGAASWLGKTAMLGSDWEGVKWL